MDYHLEHITEQIISTSYFQKLKQITENNDYHDHETVYDHLIKTKHIAQKEVLGEFIHNKTARGLFTAFINGEVSGMKRKDSMILAALLHDIGKILVYEENGKTQSINVLQANGKTYCPGHEYWGSTIVAQVLRGIVPSETITYVANIIKLHDTFNPISLIKPDWDMQEYIRDIKARAEGKYIETLFNIYCDCYAAIPFQETKNKIIEVFNEPELYTPRNYYIPE